MSNKRRKCTGELVPNVTNYEKLFQKYNISGNPNDINDSKEIKHQCFMLSITHDDINERSFPLVSVCECCKLVRYYTRRSIRCDDCGRDACFRCVKYIERSDEDLCYSCLDRRVQELRDIISERPRHDLSCILCDLKSLTYLPPELWNIVFHYAFCLNMECDCTSYRQNNINRAFYNI